jgi:hypothetical protein
LAHIAKLLGELQQPHLRADDLLVLGHVGVLIERRGWALRNPNRSAPSLGSRFSYDTVCQIKS